MGAVPTTLTEGRRRQVMQAQQQQARRITDSLATITTELKALQREASELRAFAEWVAFQWSGTAMPARYAARQALGIEPEGSPPRLRKSTKRDG